MTATFLVTALVICLAPGTGAIFRAAGLARGALAARLAVESPA